MVQALDQSSLAEWPQDPAGLLDFLHCMVDFFARDGASQRLPQTTSSAAEMLLLSGAGSGLI